LLDFLQGEGKDASKVVSWFLWWVEWRMTFFYSYFHHQWEKLEKEKWFFMDYNFG